MPIPDAVKLESKDGKSTLYPRLTVERSLDASTRVKMEWYLHKQIIFGLENKLFSDLVALAKEMGEDFDDALNVAISRRPTPERRALENAYLTLSAAIDSA